MKTTLVPTSIEAVKQVLRSIGEPVTLFGEQPVSLPPPSPVLLLLCSTREVSGAE